MCANFRLFLITKKNTQTPLYKQNTTIHHLLGTFTPSSDPPLQTAIMKIKAIDSNRAPVTPRSQIGAGWRGPSKPNRFEGKYFGKWVAGEGMRNLCNVPIVSCMMIVRLQEEDSWVGFFFSKMCFSHSTLTNTLPEQKKWRPTVGITLVTLISRFKHDKSVYMTEKVCLNRA